MNKPEQKIWRKDVAQEFVAIMATPLEFVMQEEPPTFAPAPEYHFYKETKNRDKKLGREFEYVGTGQEWGKTRRLT